jgi:hypothetical protein
VPAWVSPAAFTTTRSSNRSSKIPELNIRTYRGRRRHRDGRRAGDAPGAGDENERNTRRINVLRPLDIATAGS